MTRGEARAKNRKSSEPSSHENAWYGAREKIHVRSYDELAEVIRWAEDAGRTLIPSGSGSRPHIGNPPSGEPVIVSLSELASVLRYEPDDFTIGVQAGMPVAELTRILAENGQEIAFDEPEGASTTVGGALAVALPGPRRARSGPLRSVLIGIHGMRGGGRRFKAGGMVVKNVAGYEVGKLVLGALGTTGFITEANFKLRPTPARTIGGCASFEDPIRAWQFVRRFRDLELEPSLLQVLGGAATRDLADRLGTEHPRSGRHGGGARSGLSVVWVFQGNESVTAWLAEQGRELARQVGVVDVDLASESCRAVIDLLARADRPSAPDAGDEAIVRLCVLPSQVTALDRRALELVRHHDDLEFRFAVDALAGQAVWRWRGEPASLVAPVDRAIEWIRELGGDGWLVYLPIAMRGGYPYLCFRRPEGASRAIAARLRAVFDPRGVFCPERVLGSDTVISDTVISDTVISDPVISDPVISDPVISDPVISDPVVDAAGAAAGNAPSAGEGSSPDSESAATVSGPAVSGPAVSGPAVSGPAVSGPSGGDEAKEPS